MALVGQAISIEEFHCCVPSPHVCWTNVFIEQKNNEREEHKLNLPLIKVTFFSLQGDSWLVITILQQRLNENEGEKDRLWRKGSLCALSATRLIVIQIVYPVDGWKTQLQRNDTNEIGFIISVTCTIVLPFEAS
jgi:hypothetical protein